MEDIKLISPVNGRLLTPVSDHLLDDGDRLWPVVEGIAYLRPKEEIRLAAVAAIQENDPADALMILLADQDDFSPTDPPDRTTLLELLAATDVTLRGAMEKLNYGPVADYFAYRWCSPTFLSGRQMLELSVATDRPVVEFACGIGHFLRELEATDVTAVGVDIVFSKLWLARKFMGVRGALICGDIEKSTVVSPGNAGAVFCHDAFYFFADKDSAIDNMRRVLGPAGRLAIGHVHTDRDAHQAGHPLNLAAYRKLTTSVVWDDRALASDYSLRRKTTAEAGTTAEAVAWMEGEQPRSAGLRFEGFHHELSLNPLIGDDTISWPSDGWRKEYAQDAKGLSTAITSIMDRLSLRSLYEKKMAGVAVTKGLSVKECNLLYRNQVLVNLPPKW